MLLGADSHAPECSIASTTFETGSDTPEENRLPLVRRLAPGWRVDSHGRRRAPPDRGARRRRGGDRDRRGIRPRPPFRPPARLAVPAARRDRRQDQPDRNRDRRNRMRYENPLYMAETAAASDLLAGGRLQLGVSRGSPQPARHGAGGLRLLGGPR